MDLELNQLSTTLAVGAYFLIGLGGVLSLLFGGNFTAWLESQRKHGRAAILCYALFSFAFGIFLERFSNSISESISPIMTVDEEQVCSRVFFTRFANVYLANDTLLKKLPEITSPMLEQVRAALQKPEALRKDALLQVARHPAALSAARNLYYEAKSAVYLKDNYYQDLLISQIHIRFSRSFGIASIALFALGVAAVTSRLTRGFASGGAGRYLLEAALILGAFVLLWGISRCSHELGEEHYDKRVYGYYLHLLRQEH